MNRWGNHLRRNQLVLWIDHGGQYLLARILDAGQGGKTAAQPVKARLAFPNGREVVTPIDRIVGLPAHRIHLRRRT